MLRASSEQPFFPLPLRERVEVRGRHARSRHSGTYTRGIMPVLPVQTRREILPFEALRGSGEHQGRHFVQNDNGQAQNDSSLKKSKPFYPSPLEGEGRVGGKTNQAIGIPVTTFRPRSPPESQGRRPRGVETWRRPRKGTSPFVIAGLVGCKTPRRRRAQRKTSH